MPLKELPPHLAVFYDAVEDDRSEQTIHLTNYMCFLRDGMLIKLCGSDELAPRIIAQHLK